MQSTGMRAQVVSLVIVTSLVVSACARQEPPARAFPMRGQVLAVREQKELLIRHDEIKGFMPAMTMPYRVRDSRVIAGIAPGDLITATVNVSDTDAWLTGVQKTGSEPIAEPVPEPSPAAGVTLLREGDAVPDTTFTDAEGRAFALAAWRGSPVALTFIYTRCPLPQYCPLLDRRFAEVQKIIKADPVLAGRARLLSISFDPDADTPAVLRAHAAKLNADPAVWRFVTAPRNVVDRFAAAFAVNVIRERDRTITHNLKTAVVDSDGRVLALYEGTDWTADQLATDLRRAQSTR